eukprot:11048874-Alexandrium_andersonii.AAC.1
MALGSPGLVLRLDSVSTGTRSMPPLDPPGKSTTAPGRPRARARTRARARRGPRASATRARTAARMQGRVEAGR